MRRQYRFALFSIVFLAAVSSSHLAHAQVETASQARRLITQTIDERNLIMLRGNTRPEAIAANDRGRAYDSFPVEHIQLQLQLPAEKEQELDQTIRDMHDAASPNYHKWLTADQFRQEFSLAPADIDAVTSWLQSQGFTINVIYPRSIDFSGTAGQVRNAFHSEIHNLDVDGMRHFANMSDPMVPAALAPAIVGVVSLNDFMPRPLSRPRTNYTTGSGLDLVVPADIATIYNFNPVFARGISGQGQTIVVIEDTDVYSTADWNTFRTTLGLSSYSSGSFSQIHPAPLSGNNNCTPPGVNGDDVEAILDAEWASAGAPSAAVVLASCSNTTSNFGGFIALQNLLNANNPPPSIISISYGETESELGAAFNSYISALYMQAVSEGVSIFVSSGDEGAASSDANASYASHGITISGFTSTPYNVSVGGTDFGDTFAGSNNIYWNAANTSTFESANSYIPEIPWNNSCASGLIASYLGFATTYGSGGFCNSTTGMANSLSTTAASGGPSGCATGTPSTKGTVSGTCAGYAKPSWQSIFGNPSDSVRDVPDVSLLAANGGWGHYYVACYSDTSRGGVSCSGAPNTWSGFGGTSISSPIMAAIQALINQTNGNSAGNPSPTYYSLASAEYGAAGNSACNSTLGSGVSSSCIFYDVTQGDIDVNCKGTHNCYLPSGTNGVLSKSNSQYLPAYSATSGWDFATGIGTVNVNNLINNWPKASNPAVLSIAKAHTGNFTQGQQSATYTVTVSNAASAAPTNGIVSVTEAMPAGLTLVSMTGAGWACAGNTCTRGDVLNAGSSYATITVMVNVAANASSPQINQVNVSGGNSATQNASDSTVIIANPVLSITKTHIGNFTQGQQNATYTVTVSNAANAGLTSGTVTVTETVPSGLTLSSMSGAGWSCPVNSATCTRSDALNGGASYPAITVTLNVAPNASSPQVNQVTVSGGGSGNASATDSTVITQSAGGTTYSLWNNSAVPGTVDVGTGSPVELGMKFTTDISGYITGVRFYKSANNSGTHIGNLWNSAGQLLGSVTFSSETASGWQQMSFATPIAISANTIYVISYHDSNGHFSMNQQYFTSSATNNAPLHAPQSGTSGGNGVYVYGATSAFPNSTYQDSNYWVDVVFAQSVSTPPLASIAVTPGSQTINAGSTLQFTATGTYQDSGTADITSQVTWNSSNTAAATINNAGLATGQAVGNSNITAALSSITSNSATLMVQATPPPTCPCTIWSNSAVPTVADGGPGGAVEVGVKFTSSVNGTISGIRFYKSSANTGTHVGNLWSSTGTLLASATFSGETGSGWQQVNFSPAVTITANTVYVASYHTNVSHFSADLNFFATAGVNNPPLQALANGVNGGNGVYAYSSTSIFPSSTYSAANYWVDVVFTPTPSAPLVSIAVTPGSQTINAGSTLQFTATGTYQDSSTADITSQVTWNSSNTAAATINNAGLATGQAAGNSNITAALSSITSNSATLMVQATPPPTCPCTIWSNSAVPTVADGGPGGAVEVGVKFTSSVNGTISGIRFYKSSANTGTHVGNLWSSTGTLLASATFSGETGSGWQQVNFSPAVTITANTVYVASYHTNVSHFSADLNFFATAGVNNPPLQALANGVNGGNGVYAYSSTSIFPSGTYNAANYWVDVVFQQ